MFLQEVALRKMHIVYDVHPVLNVISSFILDRLGKGAPTPKAKEGRWFVLT